MTVFLPIYGYDSLSADILWSIVINHLPKLKEEVRTLLEQQSDSD